MSDRSWRIGMTGMIVLGTLGILLQAIGLIMRMAAQ